MSASSGCPGSIAIDLFQQRWQSGEVRGHPPGFVGSVNH
jgi:hypothetical protein